MKNSIYVLSLIVFSTLFLSTTPVKEVTQFVMTVVGDEPVLPETPYIYNEVNVPEHLLTMNDTLGYTSGGVDTTVFPLINNDVATLGRVLFYDTKLSQTQDISCGSCHKQSLSFTDDVAQSDGANMETMRNSMHLNDLGWSNIERFAWDMSHFHLEDILAVPFLDINELGIDPDELLVKLNESTYYPALFENAFGTNQIELPMVITALSDFIKSMTTFNSRLDQEAANGFANFSQAELNGMEIFRTSCAGCHFQGTQESIFPIPIIDLIPEIFNNGLTIENDDFGAGNHNPTMSGLFKAPTLRNIEVTAPYMHDGRFETLDEVIDHYSDGIVPNEWTENAILFQLQNLELTDIEKAELKSFLLTLTDESFLTNPKWSDPFESPTSNNTPTNSIQSVVLKPNPMNDAAIISFDNPSNEVVDITIHSNSGKLFQQDQIQSNEYLIQKKNLSTGIYFVKLVMGEKTSTQKLIVY